MSASKPLVLSTLLLELNVIDNRVCLLQLMPLSFSFAADFVLCFQIDMEEDQGMGARECGT